MNNRNFIMSLFALLLAFGSIIFSIIALVMGGQDKGFELEGTITYKGTYPQKVYTTTETDSTSVDGMVLVYTYEITYPYRYEIIVRDSTNTSYQFWVTAQYYALKELQDKFVYNKSYCLEEEPKYKILIDFTSYPVG